MCSAYAQKAITNYQRYIYQFLYEWNVLFKSFIFPGRTSVFRGKQIENHRYIAAAEAPDEFFVEFYFCDFYRYFSIFQIKIELDANIWHLKSQF
jgi:hypothetical protein